jgi:pilus assembly protein Flp/PilA
MTTLMKRLWKDEQAANAVEYGIIAAVIAIALMIAFAAFRPALAGLFTRTTNQMNSAQ